MNIFVYAVVLIAALTAKAGTFTFYLGKVKKVVTIVESQHTAPLGKLTFAQAGILASQVAKGQVDGTYTVRIGADDYQFTVANG